MNKICTKCGKEYKATTEFFTKDISKKDGLHSSCKVCGNKIKTIYRKVNREYLRKEGNIYYSKNKEYTLKTQKDKYKNDEKFRNRIKNGQIMREYGITLDEYNSMLKEQNNCCKICGKKDGDSIRGLCIDHDHITGKVRGLLCLQCNAAIGFLKDDINILAKAILYLENSRGDNQ